MHSHKHTETSQPSQRWSTLQQAADYCGLSERHLQCAIKEGIIRSSLVKRPDASRGRRLVDLRSLDGWIEQGLGGKSDLPALSSSRSKSHSELLIVTPLKESETAVQTLDSLNNGKGNA